VAAAARTFHGAADAMDRSARDLALALVTLTDGPGSWQGEASLQFAELSNSLHAGTQEFANNFRQMASALDSLASGLEYAQEKRREAEIGAVVGGLLLIGAIIQLGLDPVDDAATAAAVAETTALTAEATAAAAEATAVAVVALRVLATAMTVIRGLTAFVAATHLGAGLAAGGQTAMISWLASGKIDWNEIGPSVLFGTVTGLPIGKVGGALLRALRRDGVPEVEAQALARQLERDAAVAKPATPIVNGAGKPYPTIRDPRTGEPIPFPTGPVKLVAKIDRVTWTTDDRAAFIAEWYRRGFKTPAGGWKKYDIHHIRPREYGGTNDFDNLVPVERGLHQSEFNAFWRDYTPPGGE
jgi:uncharacterized protein YukE